MRLGAPTSFGTELRVPRLISASSSWAAARSSSPWRCPTSSGRWALVDRDERAFWFLGGRSGSPTVHGPRDDPGCPPVRAFGRKRHLRRLRARRDGIVVSALPRPSGSWSLARSCVGVGGGSFLAVDWALMTDIIPKASSGRFMGISNVATATNGVVAGSRRRLHRRPARGGRSDRASGPRSPFLLGPIWFAIGATPPHRFTMWREDVPLPELAVAVSSQPAA